MRKRRLQSLGRATFEIWRSDWTTSDVIKRPARNSRINALVRSWRHGGQGPPGCRVFKTDFFRLHAPNYTTPLSFLESVPPQGHLFCAIDFAGEDI
jgi:hypothetical protein